MKKLNNRKNKINCWILTHPRSGSYFLCDLLNQTKTLSYKIDEYWSGNYLSYNNRIPYCNKVTHPITLKFNINEIENKIPNIKYIKLSRKDIFKTAISYYFVQKNKAWTLEQLSKKKKIESRIKFEESEALDAFQKCMNFKNFWKAELKEKNFLEIYFEDLIQNPQNIVDKILDYFEINQKIKIKPLVEKFKMTYPLSNEYSEKLKTLVSSPPSFKKI